MKSFLSLLALAITLLANGCADSTARETAPTAEPAATYKAGHGVQLSPVAAQFADLATAEFIDRLPAEALLRTARGNFVYVVNDEWMLRTPITLAADGVTVIGGLYEGDFIVTRGVRSLWLAELQAVNGGVGCADGH